jgi:hypothetical protein
MFFYSDPEGDESSTIASVQFPYRGGKRAAAFALVFTHDRAQAERWRAAFAAGRYPDLKADPPITAHDPGSQGRKAGS